MKLAWLFVRGAESIRVEQGDGPILFVAGPGTERQRLAFRDQIELALFQLNLESRLVAAGWQLERFDTERRRKRRSTRGVRGRREGERVDSVERGQGFKIG